MMARTKRGRRSYSVGEWGRNRVRVFPDSKTGLLQIEWRENGRRLSRSLKHRDWGRAKRQADEVAAGFAVHELGGKAEAEPEPLTLGKLFDIYGAEVSPTKGSTHGSTIRSRRRCSCGSSEGTGNQPRCPGETGIALSGIDGRAGLVRAVSRYPTEQSSGT